jgi:hypothetical protein
MKARNFLTSLKKASLIVALMVVSAPQAQAGDAKVYAGSSCVPYGSNRSPSYSRSSIYNLSASQSLDVDCPAVHDDKNIARGWVRVIDQHYSDKVSCTLNSIYFSGSSAYGWWSGQESSGSSSSLQHLAFVGNSPVNSTSHYYLSCRIPPTYNGYPSSVISYQVDENS